MRKLYHHWLSPECRKIRIMLGEKKLDYKSEIERVWTPRPNFIEINPAGSVPVFVDTNSDTPICGHNAICEYIDEVYSNRPLIGETPAERAEARRIVEWFDDKFAKEVSRRIVFEKALKRLHGRGQPDTTLLRQALSKLPSHLNYIQDLIDLRNWLAGDHFSIADAAAGAHLSCLDYFGDVPWDKFPQAKEWYARIKSRPSFRTILQDSVPGIWAAAHYNDLDF
jgi:glutathione S-transferase